MQPARALTPPQLSRYESGSDHNYRTDRRLGVKSIVDLQHRFRHATACAAIAVATACAPNEHAEDNAEPASEEASSADDNGETSAASLVATPAEWETLRARLQPQLDTLDRRLRRVRNLTIPERIALRRDVNERHIERARQLGVRVTGSVEPLVAAGQLVRLADTTAYWIVRELDYSIPYVTPDTEAMLREIGQRFHIPLDSLGVPRFRLDITSALRTPDQHAELRRRNSNASRVESAHEFGTTVDIAYRRYAPPADGTFADVTDVPQWMSDSLLVETARERGAELQAALGRVLQDMQREGKLLVRMERRQTVYHITVARRFPRRRTTSP